MEATRGWLGDSGVSMAGSMLADAAEWLGEQVQTYASQAIRYECDGLMIETDATVGKTEYQVSDGFGGVFLKFTDRDFIFPAADLVFADVLCEPQSGDRIHELDSSGVVVRSFEVMPIPDEQCYRYSDVDRKILRVHTKEIIIFHGG